MIGTNYERTKLGNHLRVNDFDLRVRPVFLPIAASRHFALLRNRHRDM
jgi:hypothetical protein